MQIDFAAVSDTGRRRKRNEDRVLALQLPDGGGSVFVVADGVGGMDGGAEASQALVDTVQREFVEGDSTGDPRIRLIASIEHADRDIADGEVQAGNTTVVAVAVWDGRFVVVHVGDSRCYLLRENQLMRLTDDHSLVAEQVRAGILTEDEASNSPRRNVITRSVGTGNDLEVEARPVEGLQAGDTLLLCSDGLHGVLSAEEIAAGLNAVDDPTAAAAHLVALANDLGGPDNISVVVARVRAVD